MRTKLAASMVALLAMAMISAGGLAASASSSDKDHHRTGLLHTKAEHLRFMSTKATSRRISVIATGAVTAGGIDRPGRVTDVLRFPGGTLRYRHVARTFSGSADPQTCLITETETGRFTLGHGTGRYAGIHGSGRYALSIVGVTMKTAPDSAPTCRPRPRSSNSPLRTAPSPGSHRTVMRNHSQAAAASRRTREQPEITRQL